MSKGRQSILEEIHTDLLGSGNSRLRVHPFELAEGNLEGIDDI